MRKPNSILCADCCCAARPNPRPLSWNERGARFSGKQENRQPPGGGRGSEASFIGLRASTRAELTLRLLYWTLCPLCRIEHRYLSLATSTLASRAAYGCCERISI